MGVSSIKFGAPTYRKNEHGNIQGKSTGIVLRGGIAVVGLPALRQANSRKLILRLVGCLFGANGCHCLAVNEP